MELQDFVANVAEQFDETDSSEFTAETAFKDAKEWSSIIALCVIAMVDEEYQVKIQGDDILKANTISDLYEIVKSRCQ